MQESERKIAEIRMRLWLSKLLTSQQAFKETRLMLAAKKESDIALEANGLRRRRDLAKLKAQRIGRGSRGNTIRGNRSESL